MVIEDRRPRLQGIVLSIDKTGEKKIDEEGNEWEKCIFTLELTNFSKRTPELSVPEEIKGKKIKLVRYCCFDWHYKIGIRKTLDPEETEAVLKNKKTETVYW
ncbi:MAG: hypothetical protein QXY18_06620 [Nitrososphaerota archaeon]